MKAVGGTGMGVEFLAMPEKNSAISASAEASFAVSVSGKMYSWGEDGPVLGRDGGGRGGGGGFGWGCWARGACEIVGWRRIRFGENGGREHFELVRITIFFRGDGGRGEMCVCVCFDACSFD